MKAHILTLLLLCASLTSVAQTGDDLFREFKREPNATYMKIPPFVTALGKIFMGDDPDAQMAKKVSSVRILDMDLCPAGVKRRFERRINALSRKGYETMAHINEDGERLHIYARAEDDVVRELLIARSEEGSCTLVQVKGKFDRKDIDVLMDEQPTDE